VCADCGCTAWQVAETLNYSYVNGERRPVEVLIFQMDPAVVDEFIRVDHEVWTLGEALMPSLSRIPFLSKEVWLDDSKPGEVTSGIRVGHPRRVGRCRRDRLPARASSLSSIHGSHTPSNWSAPFMKSPRWEFISVSRFERID
jgi:hypothetical protein